MDATFTTTGDVRRVYNEDGTTKCFYVSRKNADPVCLNRVISEYYHAGNSIYIDVYGAPWVRK